MKGLAVVNGDIYIGANGYQMVRGAQKVAQDLTFALLEPYGSNRFHPMWGSLLSSMTGMPLTQSSTQEVQSEITRVVNNYITVQSALAQKSQLVAQPSNFTNNEIIQSVQSIDVTQNQTAITAQVSVVTADGTNVTVSTQAAGS